MEIKDSVVFITGANRGLGATFARLALARGARKVYAAARDPQSVRVEGVVPVRLDVTDPAQVAAAAALASDVTLVINNAAISLPGGIATAANTPILKQQFDTNVFGMLAVAQAFAPVLKHNGGGALLNMLSALSWMNAPALSAYCVAKAAAWGVTNALRSELHGQGTLVIGLHAGFIDTDMAKGFGGPKVTPDEVVGQGFDAVEAGQEEVLADEPARQVKAGLSSGVYLRAAALGV
ncbi:SDR family oxidoreductase [Ottowia thiooxydans]|uniref:SDR family oxidoreductase n=1 Tax=Ottowia thiooxydans TaxID=219182 RepID=UPI0004197D9E|nr:SDR family oxidoreductase [Ottowia thiooxydans]